MDRIPKLIKFPQELIIRIETYRSKNKIKTFSKTVYQLIDRGLKS